MRFSKIILLLLFVFLSCQLLLAQSANNNSLKDSYPNLPNDILYADIFLPYKKTPVKLSHYRDKTVVLFFLETWCGPCVRQANELEELYSSVSANGVEIIGLSTESDEKENFQEFIRQRKFSYKMGWADRKLFDSAFKITKFRGIPQTFLIRDGKLYGVFTGAAPAVSKKLKEEILKVSKTR